MEFAGYVLHKVDGLNIYYTVGLLIFLGLFIVIVYRTIKMPKSTLINIKQSIFENDELLSDKDINKQ